MVNYQSDREFGNVVCLDLKPLVLLFKDFLVLAFLYKCIAI